MRRDNDVGELDQRIVWIAGLLVKGIESIAAQAAGSESATQCFAVDEIRLRYINQEGAGLDDRKLALAYEINRCRARGRCKLTQSEVASNSSREQKLARYCCSTSDGKRLRCV